MSVRIDVMGRDAAAEAYRLTVHLPHGPADVMLPERLAGRAPSHQTAYEFIAERASAIAAAAQARLWGRTPPAPYDTLTLIGEPTHAD
ncbi:hypothetical protein AAD018_013360 [Aestuariibius insulae]|uniref:hypothetical protein n=1 Tax=Aestuariibius insulae TaxID=2058287 RepID=UPI00345ED6C0